MKGRWAAGPFLPKVPFRNSLLALWCSSSGGASGFCSAAELLSSSAASVVVRSSSSAPPLSLVLSSAALLRPRLGRTFSLLELRLLPLFFFFRFSIFFRVDLVQVQVGIWYLLVGLLVLVLLLGAVLLRTVGA